MSEKISIKLKVWRQENSSTKGFFEEHPVEDIDTSMSFLEMLDVLNEKLSLEGKDPVAFDSDCREGICGTCGAVVNGSAHGPISGTTLCQLHMRSLSDGETITLEPWRANAFPVIKDLVVDRSAFDRIIEAGGYISVKTGSAVDANAIPVKKEKADFAMDAAACIGCGACAAACPNASAMLFVAAKVSQLAQFPQGDPEREIRAKSMVWQMDAEGFGNCSNEYECMRACPKEIDVAHIAKLNIEFVSSSIS